MLLGGVFYGWLFQRAANDPRGGWLFGLAFGFVLWMLVPIPLLQWLPHRPILSGNPALGLLLARLLWGLSLGSCFRSFADDCIPVSRIVSEPTEGASAARRSPGRCLPVWGHGDQTAPDRERNLNGGGRV
jgi:hypothetical protein